MNEYWILTASHCLDGLVPILFQVVAGEVNIHDVYDLTEFRHVDKFFMHPNYTYTEKEFDIGLVKLKQPLVFSDTVQPIDLNYEDIPVGTWCNVTGWGLKSEDGLFLASHLQYVEVPTEDDFECGKVYPSDMRENMICAGYEGHDSCSADSGGPMVCNGKIKTFVDVIILRTYMHYRFSRPQKTSWGYCFWNWMWKTWKAWCLHRS